MGPDPLDRSASSLPRPVGPEDWRDRLDRWRDRWADFVDDRQVGRIAVALTAIILAAATAWWFLRPSGAGPPVESMLPVLDPAAVPAATPPEAGLVTVHVAGAVASPGLVQLPSTARTADAIAAAGGPLPEADLDRINLAAPVADAQQVYVPIVGEDPPTGADSGGPDGGPLDLNTASAEQLQTLPGIGPATAASIVAHRDEHGPFASVAELEDVPGIGPAKLDRVRSLVRVGRAT